MSESIREGDGLVIDLHINDEDWEPNQYLALIDFVQQLAEAERERRDQAYKTIHKAFTGA